MPDYIEPYIKIYEWLLRQPDLTRLDVLLISKIMQYPSGCWISSQKLGVLLGVNKRTIQRRINKLQSKGWLAVLPEYNKNFRYVWAVLKDPPIGPLFEYSERAQKKMQEQKAKNAKSMIHKVAEQLALW
jgi:predicted transcriptional regulator